MTDRKMEPWVLRDLASVFDMIGCARDVESVRRLAARRETEAEADAPPPTDASWQRGQDFSGTSAPGTKPDAPPPPAPDEYARLKADLADICVQWPGLNSPRQAIAALEALSAERDNLAVGWHKAMRRAEAAEARVFQYDTGSGYMRSMTAPHVEAEFAALQDKVTAAEADAKRLRQALLELVDGEQAHDLVHDFGMTEERAKEIIALAQTKGGNNG